MSEAILSVRADMSKRAPFPSNVDSASGSPSAQSRAHATSAPVARDASGGSVDARPAAATIAGNASRYQSARAPAPVPTMSSGASMSVMSAATASAAGASDRTLVYGVLLPEESDDDTDDDELDNEYEPTDFSTRGAPQLDAASVVHVLRSAGRRR
jgi:hypothetical protein